MADVKINMMLNDSGNTIQKRTSETKVLNSELTKTQKLAQQGVNMPAAKAGGSGGRGGGGGGGGGRPPVTSGEVVDYGRSRAIGTGTGASARDFANQAQGLGGLVRVYATLAANFFAAGAAFRALSTAMDTTNMIQGLDQLGAASGMALGSLSQRLVLATDGAVSLRTAMEATVKASSAGLNTDQILKMGKVAKNASQALGVDMTDALSRISRGVTKLEPELLDELGLFVKIEDASSKYALSVGKSTASLTDFEKRQAFANEVLDQGLKKFGEIDIQSNSYNRLAAQLANLTQSGLELINKFLTPVATILADNTGLLIGVIGLLGAKILKLAVPALGEWRSSIVSAAASAKTAAGEINNSFAENLVEKWEARLQIPDLERSVDRVQTNFKKLKNAIPSSLAKSAFASTLSKTDLNDQKQVETLSRSIGATLVNRQKQLDELKGKRSKDAMAAKAQYAAEIKYLNDVQNELRQVQAEQTKLTTQRAKLGTQSEATRASPGEFAREKISRDASRTALALDALSRVSQNTLKTGFIDSIKTLNQELPKNLGVIRRWSTLAVGSIAAVGTSAGLMLSAFSGYIAAFVGIGSLIVGAIKYFSATKKEAELTGEAFDRVEGAVKGATLTMERLGKLEDPLKFLSPENIDARATALKELGDSVYLSISRGVDQLSKMNFGDRILNFVTKLWGGDVESKMAEGLVDSLNKAFEVAGYSEVTETAKQSVENIVGAAIGSAQFAVNIQAIVKSEDKTKALELAGILEKIGKESKISSSKATELRDSLKQVNTSLQEFQRSQQPNDPLYKIATQSTDALVKLDRALKDPVTSLTAIREASKDVNFLSMIPPESAKSIIDNNKALEEYSLRAAQAQKDLKPLQDQIGEVTEKIRFQLQNNRLLSAPANNTSTMVVQARRNLENLKTQLAALQEKEVALKATIKGPELDKLRDRLSNAIGPALQAQSKLAGARLAQEISKAQTVVGNALAALLGGTQAGIKLQAELERKGIDAQIELIKATRDLNLQMAENNALLSMRNLKDERQQLELEQERSGLTRDQQTRLGSLPAEIQKVEQTLNGIKGLQAGKSPGSFGNLAVNNPQLNQILQQSKESGVAIQGAQAQKLASAIQEREKETNRISKEEENVVRVKIEQLKLEQQLVAQKLSFRSISAEQAATETATLSTKVQEYEANIRVRQEAEEYAKLLRVKELIQNNTIGLSEREKTSLLQILDLDIKRSAEKVHQVASSNEALAKLKDLKDGEEKIKAIVEDRMKADQHKLRLDEIAKDTASSLRSEQLRLLEQSHEQGRISTDQYNLQKRIIEDINAEEEYRQKRQQIFNSYKQQELELELKIARAKDLKDPAALAKFTQERDNLIAQRDAEVQGLDRVREAQMQYNNNAVVYSERVRGYADVVIDAHERMGDAIIEFAKTGKWSWKDMVNSVLEDILRLEMRMQNQQLHGILRQSFMAAFGGSSVPWTGPTFGDSVVGVSAGAPGVFVSAKGSYFSGSSSNFASGAMQKFAKGGMFTNSIVDNPTIFKFAKGVGMMGEAGPEAIMPLKRDNSGNLGVRAQGAQQKTEVVVNNYGPEKATAQETTDARGNRRIEVTVGEMTAGEMSRSGSSSQNALRGTFGLRPQLIRR